jgi:hypothetical protein
MKSCGAKNILLVVSVMFATLILFSRRKVNCVPKLAANVYRYELWRVSAHTFLIKSGFGKSAGFSK